MDSEVKRDWVQALRSRDYRQTNPLMRVVRGPWNTAGDTELTPRAFEVVNHPERELD